MGTQKKVKLIFDNETEISFREGWEILIEAVPFVREAISHGEAFLNLTTVRALQAHMAEPYRGHSFRGDDRVTSMRYAIALAFAANLCFGKLEIDATEVSFTLNPYRQLELNHQSFGWGQSAHQYHCFFWIEVFEKHVGEYEAKLLPKGWRRVQAVG